MSKLFLFRANLLLDLSWTYYKVSSCLILQVELVLYETKNKIIWRKFKLREPVTNYRPFWTICKKFHKIKGTWFILNLLNLQNNEKYRLNMMIMILLKTKIKMIQIRTLSVIPFPSKFPFLSANDNVKNFLLIEQVNRKKFFKIPPKYDFELHLALCWCYRQKWRRTGFSISRTKLHPLKSRHPRLRPHNALIFVYLF